MKLNIATLALILVAAVLITMRAMQLPWTPAHITGFAIAAPAFLLFVLARVFNLGQAFSVQAKASTLVTTGLYSRIRNPIYVFGALIDRGSHCVDRQAHAAARFCRSDPFAGRMRGSERG